MIDTKPKKINSYIGHGFWVPVGACGNPVKLKVNALDVRYGEDGEFRIVQLRLSDMKWRGPGELFASKKDFYRHQAQLARQKLDDTRSKINIKQEEIERMQARLKEFEAQIKKGENY